MNRKIILARQTMAYLLSACMAVQPAFAGITDISNVPLGSEAGAGVLPNLLFTLDDSGSMASDYNPDYVNDNNSCMITSGGDTSCNRGDAPFEAGGEHGFNGVGYDPNFTYQSGLTSAGQPIINPPSGTLSPTSLTPDAYLGGSSVNLTTSITDNTYCNSNSNPKVCKRAGANASGTIFPAGALDAEGNTLAAGQYPYRAHSSSTSTSNFGMPEMMTTASFSRSGSTVTGITIGKPSLTTSDKVYVAASNTNFNAICAAVTSTSANSFTYSTASSGTISPPTNNPPNGTYRKCGSGTWSRPTSGSSAQKSVITVTSSNHGLVTNDILTVNSDNNSQDVTNVSITVSDANTFTYTGANSGSSSGTLVGWERTGLYNVVTASNGPPMSYSLTPLEYCRDLNLTDCVEVIPPATPTAPYINPAYVRFCKTRDDAIAPGTVTGTSIVSPATTATNRCQLKFVNVTGLTNYIYPRFGRFNRDTIVSGLTFKNRLGRSDCVTTGTKPDCTYTEELQNYAKWYTYYRTRMQMMKTSAGRAFLPFISNPSATPKKPDRLRVGFITINPTVANGSSGAGSSVDSSKYLKISAFNTTNASSWYTKFYAIIPGPSTPLRIALARAGWIYAGKLNTGLTSGIPTADDPLQASCQKNYTFLTTDGFWNQGTGLDIVGAGSAIGNMDNVDNSTAAPYASPNFFVSRASGTYDGGLLSGTTAGTSPGGSSTLADIALYYYKTDLRPTGSTSPNTTPAGGDVSTNNVQAKTGSADFATHQHMTTFTIGLADGLMRYEADYDSATKTTGDFANIKSGATGQCFWNGSGTCNWPSPQADGQSALDDLWHAAVNGRGKFFSALNPNALAAGLSGALNALDIQTASAAAAATSSPQVSQENTKAFSTTYQTSTWSGQIYAQPIDPQTGDVVVTGLNHSKVWEAHKLLLDKITPTSDTRSIFTIDPTATTRLKTLTWLSLSVAEKAFFLTKCLTSALSQCSSLSVFVDLPTANDGSSLLAFLRGQTSNEASPGCTSCVFRDRTEQDPDTGLTIQTVMGDTINAQPVSVLAPFFKYENEPIPEEVVTPPTLPGETYPTFRTNNASRLGPLLIAANDGYLHGFDPNTGIENWAYAPRFVLPGMYQLADKNYAGQHRYFVDGTPETGDVYDTTTKKWRTIVVGGVNSGGRGFYALDITDPVNPKGLWEFCSDSTLCLDEPVSGFSHSDADLGYSFGNPVIGRRALDGKWVVVVTSGLNNVSTGTGLGYFYVLDAITGRILHKVSTGVGSTATPSGLMKMGAFYPDGINDPTFTHLYGGDQLGNVWRVDMSQTMSAYPTVTTGAPVVMLMATLKDANGRIQPITARPAGTHIGTTRIYYVGTGRYLGNGLNGGVSDLDDPLAPSGIAWQQSIYGIRDQLDNPAFTPPANFRTGTAPGKVVQQTLQAVQGNRTISKNAVNWATQDGFFIDLNPGDTTPGERIFLDVRLVQGSLIFTSNIPTKGGACVAGGNSIQYTLDFKTGGYVGNVSTAPAGKFLSEFLVGAAIVQTADNQIKALNKTIGGDNITTPIPIDASYQGTRFSYRER